jgi:hypothetical protein
MLLVGFFTTLLALGLFRKAEPLFAYFSPNINRLNIQQNTCPGKLLYSYFPLFYFPAHKIAAVWVFPIIVRDGVPPQWFFWL